MPNNKQYKIHNTDIQVTAEIDGNAINLKSTLIHTFCVNF